MMKYLVAGVLAMGFATASHSATFLDQAFDPNTPVHGANFNEGSARLFDDFTLSGSEDLGKVTIWGVHWTSGQPPVNEDFQVQINADNGGSLGSVVGTSSLSILSRTDTGIDHNNFQGADILEYVFDFDSTVTLGAGTYWISVFLGTPNPNAEWAHQRTSTSGNSIGGSGELAMVLESQSISAVPLPASLPLLLAGIGGLGLAGRRRKAA